MVIRSVANCCSRCGEKLIKCGLCKATCPEKVISLTGLNGEFRKIDQIAPPGNFPVTFIIGAGVKRISVESGTSTEDLVKGLGYMT